MVSGVAPLLTTFRLLAKLFGRLHESANGVAQQGIERFDPENLILEDYPKVTGDGFGDGIKVEVAAEFVLHGSDWL